MSEQRACGGLRRRTQRLLGSWTAVVASASASCGGGSATPASYDFGDAAASVRPDTGPGSLGGVTFGGGGDSGAVTPASPDCPPAAALIYVTGVGNALYRFDPTQGSFTLVGTLTCLASPTHMTVDRQAVAWIVSGGLLYRASTSDAACSRVSTWSATPGFDDFALTFLGTSSATDDALYVLGTSGELGRFNPASGGLVGLGTTVLGPARTTADGSRSDMTTNGDGTLYVTDDIDASQSLNRVSPSNAALLATYATGQNDSVDTGALAYYGALFYDFVGMSVVTFDASTKAVATLGQAPIQVTGAGQSTCVPTSAVTPAPLR